MDTWVSPAIPLAHAHSGEMSESEAIQLARSGDGVAFERLYQLHSRRVYSLCLRMIGNTAEAEDLTQEAFLQLFRKIKTFRGESAFSTWLHRLAVNVVLMRLRKRTINQTSLEQDLEYEESAPREIGARDLVLAGVIDRMSLKDAIARLPEGYRLVFVLHDVQGFEHHEIAEQLRCSIGNSKSQLHKARMRLRQFLIHPEARPGHQQPDIPLLHRCSAALKSPAERRCPRRLKLCTSEL